MMAYLHKRMRRTLTWFARSKECMQNSPYEDLMLDLIHRELEYMFATEFSASLEISKHPPRRVVGDIGGGSALVKIEKH